MDLPHAEAASTEAAKAIERAPEQLISRKRMKFKQDIAISLENYNSIFSHPAF